MEVKVRKEIIRLDKKVDLKKTGTYLSPREFLDFYTTDDFMVLDARNYYEYDSFSQEYDMIECYHIPPKNKLIYRKCP